MSHTFALLVPVKTLALAKSRLELGHEHLRAPLMRAFALDAIETATRTGSVGRVYVVTDEPGFEVGGAVRLPDEGDGDLNRALVHASLRVRLLEPTWGVAAMCADLPCVSDDDLQTALASGLSPRWFVADAAGSGTTLLAAAPGTDLDPHFGAESARRHERSGAMPVRAQVETVRRDVDTEGDLASARVLGVGPRTTAVLTDGDRTG
jgi:2-phospho-L-lactate guanylyltransferase